MSEKCFCHLVINGEKVAVKDVDARKEINQLKERIAWEEGKNIGQDRDIEAFRTRIEEAEADISNLELGLEETCNEWDHIITTGEDFAKISSFTGTVLVKGLNYFDLSCMYEDYEFVDNIVINASYLKFIGCSFTSSQPVTLTGNKNCTIDGFYWCTGPDCLSLSTFGKVINCKHDSTGDIDGYPLTLTNCDYVHNCDFGTASNCHHISDCALTINAYNTVLSGCTHIHGLKLDMQSDDDEQSRECIFDTCSYMSNINVLDGTISTLSIIYNNCTYVDADTCSGFVPATDVGKVRAITNDGSYNPVELSTAPSYVWGKCTNDEQLRSTKAVCMESCTVDLTFDDATTKSFKFKTRTIIPLYYNANDSSIKWYVNTAVAGDSGIFFINELVTFTRMNHYVQFKGYFFDITDNTLKVVTSMSTSYNNIRYCYYNSEV